MENKYKNPYHTIKNDDVELYTYQYGIDILLPYLDKTKTYWAPFDLKESNFVWYLQNKGYKIIHSHIDLGQDVFTYEPKEHYDAIISNPPFKQKTKFLKRIMEFNKPFAILLPMNAFCDNGIPKLYLSHNKDPELLIPNKRMCFINGGKKKISFKSIYYCWGFLPKQLVFCDMDTKKKDEYYIKQTI